MLSKLIPDGCPPIQPPGTGCPAASATRDVFYGYDILGRQLTAKYDSAGGADGITNAYDGFGNLASSTVAMAGFSKPSVRSMMPTTTARASPIPMLWPSPMRMTRATG